MERREFLSSGLIIAGSSAMVSHAIAGALSSAGLAGESLKNELVTTMLTAGAYEVKIADPTQGFENGITTRNPLSIFPPCRSANADLIMQQTVTV